LLNLGNPDSAKTRNALVVIEADDIEAARAIAGGDPFARVGLFETVDIKPWNWVFNNPASA